MKEDILEQLVDDYLQSKGYFTRHNIKFLPRSNHPDFNRKLDSNHSDIDIIGINPTKKGRNRVWAVSCKSWQSGFKVERKLKDLAANNIVSGREAWKSFRELMIPKWSEAFINKVEAITGTRRFTYVTAVTVVVGDRLRWEHYKPFIKAMRGNRIKMIELSEILKHLQELTGTTLASSDIGRVLQLMRAAQKGKDALLQTVEAQSLE